MATEGFKRGAVTAWGLTQSEVEEELSGGREGAGIASCIIPDLTDADEAHESTLRSFYGNS